MEARAVVVYGEAHPKIAKLQRSGLQRMGTSRRIFLVRPAKGWTSPASVRPIMKVPQTRSPARGAQASGGIDPAKRADDWVEGRYLDRYKPARWRERDGGGVETDKPELADTAECVACALFPR